MNSLPQNQRAFAMLLLRIMAAIALLFIPATAAAFPVPAAILDMRSTDAHGALVHVRKGNINIIHSAVREEKNQ
jgi:hypothetical protein